MYKSSTARAPIVNRPRLLITWLEFVRITYAEGLSTAWNAATEGAATISICTGVTWWRRWSWCIPKSYCRLSVLKLFLSISIVPGGRSVLFAPSWNLPSFSLLPLSIRPPLPFSSSQPLSWLFSAPLPSACFNCSSISSLLAFNSLNWADWLDTLDLIVDAWSSCLELR